MSHLLITRPLAAVVLLVGASVAPAQPGGPPAVVVAPVVADTVAATQTFVGTVEPLRRVTIGSAVDGRVVEYLVEEGDRVDARQPLARLLTETISLELAGAEADLELRRQQLAELRNGSRPEEIAQARARAEAARARERYATAQRDRVQKVFRTGSAITEDEYEESIALAAEAEQQRLEAEAALALAVAGPRVEVIAQAQAQVAVQEATVQRLSDQIKKHTIISRFPGYVVAEHSDEGAWVNRGDPIAEVVAVDEVEVVAQVVEGTVAFVEPGSETEVVFPALGGRAFTGRVVATVPLADSRSRTFPVKLRVKNEIGPSGPTVLPGMLARVNLPVSKPTDALLVPKDAVVLGGRSPVVFVVDPSGEGAGTVRPVPVQIGVATSSRLQVTGDLKPGELVVVEGNERLRPGAPVRVIGRQPQAGTTASAN